MRRRWHFVAWPFRRTHSAGPGGADSTIRLWNTSNALGLRNSKQRLPSIRCILAGRSAHRSGCSQRLIEHLGPRRIVAYLHAFKVHEGR
jgi:hypothetical protein